MTNPNKPKKGYLFLSPEAQQAWEQGVRRNLAERARGVLLTAGVMIILALLFAPLIKRLIPPTPTPEPPQPPALSQSEADALCPAFEERIAKLNHDYAEAVALYFWQADDLNSPSTFRSQTATARITKALTATDDVEHKYNTALHELPGQALQMAHRPGLNDLQKSCFLRLHQELVDLFKAEDDFMATQHELIQNEVQLYRFTSKYAGSIRVKNYKVVFSDPALNDQFRAQWNRQSELIYKNNAAESAFHAYLYPEKRSV